MKNDKTTSNGRKAMTAGAATLALCMAMASGGAFAQGRGDDRGPGGPGGPRYDQRDDRRGDWRQDRRDDRHDNRRDDRRDHRYDARQDDRPGSHFDRNGYYPRPADWRRGGRLPPEYRNRQYVVDDYRAYQLQPPPRGYQWIGVGGEFALAAIATGLIAQIIVNR